MAKGKKKSTVAKKSVKAAPKKSVAKKSPAKKAPAKVVAKKRVVKKIAPKKSSPKKAASKVAGKAVKKAPKKGTAIKATSASAFVTKKSKPVDLSDFVTPLDDRVIIQPAENEKMTAGGLYIPDTVADVAGNLQGTVVSVGRGHRNKKGQVRPMDLRVGDKVLFADYTGSKIKIQNHDLVIVREGDVLGVVG